MSASGRPKPRSVLSEDRAQREGANNVDAGWSYYRNTAGASALSLITWHRSLAVIDLERAQVDAKRLDVEHDRLRIDQSRLSQPAYVESEARKIGMKPLDAARTVFLNLPAAETKK
jgi:cell division protein FtsL